jgi:hypothetical protein
VIAEARRMPGSLRLLMVHHKSALNLRQLPQSRGDLDCTCRSDVPSLSPARGPIMRIARTLGLIVLAMALQGCAAVGLAVVGAGAGVSAGAGIEHTMNGIVYKTFDASMNEVRFATLKTLDHLGMPVTDDEKSEDGWKLSATATERTIDIELQQLTERTTRMRVVANDGKVFFKDASTATEIIVKTAHTLEDDEQAAKSESKRKRKPT